MAYDLLVRTLLVGLAGWRLAAMLSYETGPFDVFERIRIRIGMNEVPMRGFLPALISCVWCVAVWTCTALWFAWDVHPVLVALPATWAVAVMVERWNRG